jgi:inorganic phosphate transporter, PiT family
LLIINLENIKMPFELTTILLIVFAIGLAFVNGGNDNLKGVATLLGSKVLSYRQGLTVASIATVAGSVVSIFLAGGLLKAFSGKGLVPDDLTQSLQFITAVSGAAMITVAIATRVGLPISTTHALVGGLIGSGLALAPGALKLDVLGKVFFLPLIISPVIALFLAFVLSKLFADRSNKNVDEKTACICVANNPGIRADGIALMRNQLVMGDATSCPATTHIPLIKTSASQWVDALHILSGAAVCFARGLNDTPKIAALLLLGHLSGASASSIIAIAMLLGGILTAKRVAKTMSQDITKMNAQEGLTTNLVTSILVIIASKFSLPVSTTHVSCGALFGLATGKGQAQWRTITGIVLSWLGTLPLAILIAFILSKVLS